MVVRHLLGSAVPHSSRPPTPKIWIELDDGERCQHRAVTTHIAKECGSLSVRLFLITQLSTDARKPQLALSSHGLMGRL